MKQYNEQSGEMNTLTIPFIVTVILVIGLGGFSIWSYLNYTDAKSDLDGKISLAVKAAKKDQSTADDKVFAEQVKLPYLTYNGPSDLGSVNFKYPKTWSVYVEKDGTKGSLLSLEMNPTAVNGFDLAAPPALKVSVEDAKYENVVLSYQTKVKSGELVASPITISGVAGTRFDGLFDKAKPRGSLVVLKIRDKSLQVALGSPDYLQDYNEAVLKNLTFNP
jgi:hypothetical protein